MAGSRIHSTADLCPPEAAVFDLDGVLTRTARIHAAAWKAMFDEYLSGRPGARLRPFDIDGDYRRYVDGRARYDGVRSFLAARGIELPEGDPSDPPGRDTVCGLGNRKNALFLQRLDEGGVEVYEGAVAFVRSLKDRAVPTAVVSASKNCLSVLRAAGLEGLFDVRVDGVDAERRHLAGKPAPDVFLEACRRLSVGPAGALAVEDAVAGVQAARRAGVGQIVGVDRDGRAGALWEAGADRVVQDLGGLALADPALPSALACLTEIRRRAAGRSPAVFLDYDGTLTPIVERPGDAVLGAPTRGVLQALARHCPVAIISGRDLEDVRERVGLDGVYYAGSHGFDIAGPDARRDSFRKGTEYLPELDRAEADLRSALASVDGSELERKRFSVAVHYRRVADSDRPRVTAAVDAVVRAHPTLRRATGKKVYEVQPGLEWDKGKAVRWLTRRMALSPDRYLVLYIGDDDTDEDAFRELQSTGVGILVSPTVRPSLARYRLDSPGDVRRFLARLAEMAAP